jgi:hypothetical protein
MDPGIFFPEAETPQERQNQYKEPRKVCASCEVRVACLNYYMDHAGYEEERYGGFVGGTSPSKRDRMRRIASHRRQEGLPPEKWEVLSWKLTERSYF